MLYDYPELHAEPEELDRYACPDRNLARLLRPSIAADGPWDPIHHGQLRAMILEAAASRALTVKRETYNFGRRSSKMDPGMLGMDADACARARLDKRNPHQLFGCIEFDQCVPGRDDVTMAFGFRHCNLQTFKLTIVAGNYVMVCSNGCISGENVGEMMHKDVAQNLLGVVRSSFETWTQQQAKAGAFLQAMEDTDLTDGHAARLLLEATQHVVDQPASETRMHPTYRRRACLSSSRVARCWSIWKDRERDGGAFEQRNAWALYNAVNEHAKGYRPRVAETAVRGFGAMLADELTFSPEATPSLALVPVGAELN